MIMFSFGTDNNSDSSAAATTDVDDLCGVKRACGGEKYERLRTDLFRLGEKKLAIKNN